MLKKLVDDYFLNLNIEPFSDIGITINVFKIYTAISYSIYFINNL